MSFYYLKIGGTKTRNVDATLPFTTDAFEISKSASFSATLESTTIVGGTPTYTVQVSNGKKKWYEFSTSSTNVAVGNSIESSSFNFRFVRIVYTPNGVTAGTIDLGINVKL